MILRCLESALPCFDELCLVRAIGSQEPDRTAEVAEVFCKANGKAFRFAEYNNRVDMPHVDHFADARQMSFDLATCDWQLWLDCDDYLEEIGARRIREAARVSKADAVFAGYQIDGKGSLIPRERLIRRGCGQWRNAIHEVCIVEGEKEQCPAIVVFHGDHKHKHKSSSERNARILEGVVADVGRNVFYASQEFKQVGRLEDSVRMARAALELLPPERIDERYSVLLTLSELDIDRRQDHLHNAAKLQPHRREAFAYLCQSALIDGRMSDAISWFRMMDALPLPEPLPWTHQGAWYAEGREYLRIRILRASNTPGAEEQHAELMESNPDYASLAA